jgi:hypothetical protein
MGRTDRPQGIFVLETLCPKDRSVAGTLQPGTERPRTYRPRTFRQGTPWYLRGNCQLLGFSFI